MSAYILPSQYVVLGARQWRIPWTHPRFLKEQPEKRFVSLEVNAGVIYGLAWVAVCILTVAWDFSGLRKS